MNKILRLDAENIKVLKAVTIEPSGNIVEITGKNGQGKSSVLDSIIMALCGKKTIPDKPVRDGEKEGTIRLDIGNLIVTRKIKENGESSIKVTNKDGASYSSPQSILDELVNNIGFDPLKFSQLKPQEQVEELKKIVKIDFDFEDAERKYKELYQDRTMVNRFVKELEIKKDSILIDSDTPSDFVSVSEISNKIKEANEFNNIQSQLKQRHENGVEYINQLKQKEKEIQEQIKLAEEKLNNLEKPKDFIDTKDLIDTVENAEIINNKVRKKQDKEKINKELLEYKLKQEDISNKMQEIINQKEKALKEAKMPIDDLSIGDGVVLYKNIPFEQCSQGEKIKISTSIAMSGAKDKNLSVVLIKDGSLLDEDNLKIISDMANEKDFQVWIERVDSTGEVGVVIEDGMVKGVK